MLRVAAAVQRAGTCCSMRRPLNYRYMTIPLGWVSGLKFCLGIQGSGIAEVYFLKVYYFTFFKSLLFLFLLFLTPQRPVKRKYFWYLIP